MKKQFTANEALRFMGVFTAIAGLSFLAVFVFNFNAHVGGLINLFVLVSCVLGVLVSLVLYVLLKAKEKMG